MKAIPIALQSHLDQDATTLCEITRVYTKSGTLLGFAALDVDITYNPATVDPESTGDDWGSAVHHAENGIARERMQASADLSVDNTDLQGWVSDSGITEESIRAGLFDYAQVRIYRINYMDVTQGHELVASGTLGETKFSANSWRTEFRSLTQQLKQPLAKLFSIPCGAQFGDARCGKAFVWTTSTVTAVSGTEPDRIFTDTANTEADGFYELGVVEWLTGNNAGVQMEVDSQVSDVFTQSLSLPYAIQVGDEYRRRQDCDKSFTMCRDTHDNVDMHRGFPDIPVADGGQLMVPGALIRR
jgi:uncharacterized phage protein (TIGR02218 family)